MLRLLSIYLLFLSSALYAQEQHPYIKNLKASSSNGKLLVSWTTKAGFSCEDIVVQLSKDSLNFQDVAIYWGTCGDTSERQYVLRLDTAFTNQKNYIRLDLGNFGTSYVVSEVVLHIQTALLYPMPRTERSVLRISNVSRQVLSLYVRDMQGQLIHQAESRENTFELSSLQLPIGIYTYVVSDGVRVLYRGKFL